MQVGNKYANNIIITLLRKVNEKKSRAHCDTPYTMLLMFQHSKYGVETQDVQTDRQIEKFI